MRLNLGFPVLLRANEPELRSDVHVQNKPNFIEVSSELELELE